MRIGVYGSAARVKACHPERRRHEVAPESKDPLKRGAADFRGSFDSAPGASLRMTAWF